MPEGVFVGDEAMIRALPQTSMWTAAHIRGLHVSPMHRIPLVDRDRNRLRLPHTLTGFDLWDMWPVQSLKGDVMRFEGRSVWFVLSARADLDPDARHHVARIRLLSEGNGVWHDHGNALPDGFNPGGREWAGSAVCDRHGALTLYFTAAGLPQETSPSYAQRIFSTSASIRWSSGAPVIGPWSDPDECLVSDNNHYLQVGPHEGKPGFIKGFRDPAFFRDPNGDRELLLFTGTCKQSESAWNGCIGAGIRTQSDRTWVLLPPLLSADGLNNELERPHLIHHQSKYYLFWSTQRRTFADPVHSGPNGLYAMVGDDAVGPYRPVNGSGLVAANPEAAPFQTYSWWVTPDLTVHGFVDLTDTDGSDLRDDPAWRRAHFVGGPAPVFRIALDGDRGWVA